MKTLWFVRGVSGAGKSTVANKLLALGHASWIEADDYRYVGDEYVYREEQNHEAHKKCREAARRDAKIGFENLIISNTSTRKRDVNYWKNFAKEHGYQFISIVVENYHESGNVHGVADDVLQRMANQLQNSIKLV